VNGENCTSFELLEKYQALLAENRTLKEEIKTLKSQLDHAIPHIPHDEQNEHAIGAAVSDGQSVVNSILSTINGKSNVVYKVRLFMSLFKGRDDVYAIRWESKKKGSSGYSPCCRNEWQRGVCAKPKVKCADCRQKSYAPFDNNVVEEHLRGKIVAGIYPMLIDETCWFLAIDFDKGEWQKDVTALREVAAEFSIPLAVERSRSGNGAHVWFFFQIPLSATMARKFGTSLLTCAMSKRHEITFKSYDRFFPNQDTMPSGGLGNLIALPLQKEARTAQHSEFIDEIFEPYADQWAFLGTIQKLSEDDVNLHITKLCQGNELGILKVDEEDTLKPWDTAKVTLRKTDFPRSIEIVKANMLFIPKSGISQRALNRIKRLAAFRNPEFYKKQAMRFPTYDEPRIICCADDTAEYLCLPRGCEEELRGVLSELGLAVNWVDKTNWGNKIDVEFKGYLRDEQPQALDKMLEHDSGVLSGTTAFGKTVVAIRLIAERKVNTLIIVDRASLIVQWKKRLPEFLTINEALPMPEPGRKRRGRKNEVSIIGQVGQGKVELGGVIDIALMQSLNRMGDVRECVKNYGMIIVDECHHVASVSFETILKTVTAKYVYGLTATPTRKDGRHPIIFMQCGPVRYRDDARRQAEKRPFDHYVIPRFTSLRPPLDKEEKEVTIQSHYAEMIVNELRNQLIVDDVVKSHEEGRNCLVLTDRTAHVDFLAGKLNEKIPDVISLTGRMGAKETGEILKRLVDTPAERQLTLIATGKYIGEGFDEPRLDTLFLTMPISWKGTLQQYAGRLHRLFDSKKEVQIYDYVDIHVKMLEKMYSRRLNGYAAIGYKAKAGNVEADTIDIIFNKGNFLPVYSNDVIAAKREILIVSPFVTKRRTLQMLPQMEVALRNGVKIVVVTRKAKDFKGKDTAALQGTLDLLKNLGVSMVFRSNIHQKFAVIDQRIVWYGSINLLSFGDAEESVMRLECPNIANELIKIMGDN